MEQTKLIEDVKTRVTDICQTAKFEVVSPVDYEKASIVLKNTRKLLRVIDEKEKEVTRPLWEGLEKARGLFKPYKEALNRVIRELNSQTAAFRRKQAEEARKKQAEFDKQVKPDDIFKPVVEPEVPKVEGLRVRKNWKYRVVDINKVDRKFLIVDERKVGEIVRAMKEKAVEIVGGIEVFVEETTY